MKWYEVEKYVLMREASFLRRTIPYIIQEQRETHSCTLNTVATDALVLKHLAIIIHIAD